MNSIIFKDDKLSRVSLNFAYISIILFVFSILINIISNKFINISATLGLISYVLSIFGIVSFLIARKLPNENIGRCLKSFVFNSVLCTLYSLIFLFNI